MRAPTLRDSRGNKSVSLFLIMGGFMVIVGQVIANYWLGKDPFSIAEFAGAVALLVGALQTREWKQKDIEANNVKYPEFD